MSALPVGRVFAQEFFPGLEIPIIDAHAHLPGELSSDFEGYTFQAIRGAKMCATSMAVIGDNLIGNDMQRHGSDDKDDTGLTEFGCQVVRRMNRLGIIVDVSHASTQTLLDVAACTRAPIVDSHTSMLPPKVTVRAGSRQRLYSDAEAIVDTGGVVCTYPYGDDANGRTTLNDWVKEIKLSKSHFGMRHIGFGSDSGAGSREWRHGRASAASAQFKPLLVDLAAPLRPALLMHQSETGPLVEMPGRIQAGERPKVDSLVAPALAEIHGGMDHILACVFAADLI